MVPGHGTERSLVYLRRYLLLSSEQVLKYASFRDAPKSNINYSSSYLNSRRGIVPRPPHPPLPPRPPPSLIDPPLGLQYICKRPSVKVLSRRCGRSGYVEFTFLNFPHLHSFFFFFFFLITSQFSVLKLCQFSCDCSACYFCSTHYSSCD